MSRRRNRNTNKANNSNLVGLIATVIKEGDKNKGKRVLIEEVNNDIAKVFLLDDKKMNKFYLPVSDLRIFSRERSQEYLLENVIDSFMGIVSKAINGDDDWRKHARGMLTMHSSQRKSQQTCPMTRSKTSPTIFLKAAT